MKKNIMMRVASALLVAVLMSTCAISGTFAKYVTEGSASDSARVAKWGVTATVEGTLFADSYKDNPTTYTTDETGDSITVQAEAVGTNVVAPGTQNDEGMTIVLTGKPEVDVKVEFTMAVVDNKEIKLEKGEYYDPTTGDTKDTFTVDEDYYPVIFTLTKDNEELISGNVAAIQKWLTENLNKDYDANTDLSDIHNDGNGEYKLTWAWAFEDASATESYIDAADTYLGNAATSTDGATGATTDIEISFTVSVTQID